MNYTGKIETPKCFVQSCEMVVVGFIEQVSWFWPQKATKEALIGA